MPLTTEPPEHTVKNPSPPGYRFSRIYELLDVYAAEGFVFTDTPEQPGPALESYLRILPSTPERGVEVVDQINDLINVGLFSSEIADDVDIMPQIRPTGGRSVEDCLRIARDHIIECLTNPNTANLPLPQNDWEWRKRFPGLAHLLGSYFHQDFSEEYGSHEEAVADYLEGTPAEAVRQTARELGHFLTVLESDVQLDSATSGLGLSVYPPKGKNLRQWLAEVRETLNRDLQP
ncbi:contact-dependent growth inhibition system immunity protein [Streptomyces chrestomyceticus]|uniref:contact-dependent growth inhibition system immunity protein n=1 Tax=Streptomyces chrestomyceticus TaxID=68185 RepID=UPI00379DFF6B